jgi:hypothetical protein
LSTGGFISFLDILHFEVWMALRLKAGKKALILGFG